MRSKTPEPSTRVPQTQPISHRSLDSAETRPRTPEHHTRTVETRPRTHESRPKTAVYRGRSPRHRETISQNQQRSFEMGQRSPQAHIYLGSKAESENDDESVLLYPELILSPQERPPITVLLSTLYLHIFIFFFNIRRFGAEANNHIFIFLLILTSA